MITKMALFRTELWEVSNQDTLFTASKNNALHHSILKQERQCAYKVTIRGVRVTIVAMENQ
jgi:hypothetical protein